MNGWSRTRHFNLLRHCSDLEGHVQNLLGAHREGDTGPNLSGESGSCNRDLIRCRQEIGRGVEARAIRNHRPGNAGRQVLDRDLSIRD